MQPTNPTITLNPLAVRKGDLLLIGNEWCRVLHVTQGTNTALVRLLCEGEVFSKWLLTPITAQR